MCLDHRRFVAALQPGCSRGISMAFRAVAPTVLLVLAGSLGTAAAQGYPQYRPLPPTVVDANDDDSDVIPQPGYHTGAPAPAAAGPGDQGPAFFDQHGRRVQPPIQRDGTPTVYAPPGFIYPDEDRRQPANPNFRQD